LYSNRASSASALAKPLALLTNLTNLGIGRNAIGDGGLEKLLPSLASLPDLRILGLQHDDLGPASSPRLASLIQGLPALENVLLYGNSLHMGTQGIRPLEECRHIITWDTDI
jgi:Ran GTPase-activating protein (RanGAP) involved in mRNA processing and transport